MATKSNIGKPRVFSQKDYAVEQKDGIITVMPKVKNKLAGVIDYLIGYGEYDDPELNPVRLKLFKLVQPVAELNPSVTVKVNVPVTFNVCCLDAIDDDFRLRKNIKDYLEVAVDDCERELLDWDVPDHIKNIVFKTPAVQAYQKKLKDTAEAHRQKIIDFINEHVTAGKIPSLNKSEMNKVLTEIFNDLV